MQDRRSDAELLKAAEDEPEAFGVFYDRHVRMLLAFFYRRSASAGPGRRPCPPPPRHAAPCRRRPLPRAHRGAGVGRRSRRAPRRRLALVAATALLALVVPLGVNLLGDRGGRALAISDQGGTITVRLLEAGADPARVSRELRDAGIDAEVRSVPVPPGQAGTWVAALGPPEIGGRLEGAGAVLRLPAATPGRVELVIGRPARPGERYAAVARRGPRRPHG